jgi:hypothetical protein
MNDLNDQLRLRNVQRFFHFVCHKDMAGMRQNCFKNRFRKGHKWYIEDKRQGYIKILGLAPSRI